MCGRRTPEQPYSLWLGILQHEGKQIFETPDKVDRPAFGQTLESLGDLSALGGAQLGKPLF